MNFDDSAFHAFLCLEHNLENLAPQVKSKKQYDTYVRSLLRLLLTNYDQRSFFLSLGGDAAVIMKRDTCEALKVFNKVPVEVTQEDFDSIKEN